VVFLRCSSATSPARREKGTVNAEAPAGRDIPDPCGYGGDFAGSRRIRPPGQTVAAAPWPGAGSRRRRPWAADTPRLDAPCRSTLGSRACVQSQVRAAQPPLEGGRQTSDTAWHVLSWFAAPPQHESAGLVAACSSGSWQFGGHTASGPSSWRRAEGASRGTERPRTGRRHAVTSAHADNGGGPDPDRPPGSAARAGGGDGEFLIRTSLPFSLLIRTEIQRRERAGGTFGCWIWGNGAMGERSEKKSSSRPWCSKMSMLWDHGGMRRPARGPGCGGHPGVQEGSAALPAKRWCKRSGGRGQRSRGLGPFEGGSGRQKGSGGRGPPTHGRARPGPGRRRDQT